MRIEWDRFAGGIFRLLVNNGETLISCPDQTKIKIAPYLPDLYKKLVELKEKEKNSLLLNNSIDIVSKLIKQVSKE